MKPKFFATPEAFRKWLAANHARADELLVGYYKRGSGKPSMTWPESVDQALCFGWIDGVRKSIDDESYTIRFTPRRPNSIWSAVNIKNAERLIEQGLMQPAGRRVFDARDPRKTNRYSFEQQNVGFDADKQKQFKANKAAWKFFEAQPPGYRKIMTFWVMSAKLEATRARRLARLIEASAAGRRI